MADLRFPNESRDYRTARDSLLKEELALREQIAWVARQRRALPPGGLLKEDYVFGEQVGGKGQSVRFSERFGPGKDALFLYNFMYPPDMQAACPMCAAFLDGLHGQLEHLGQRINVAVVTRHSLGKIHELAASL